MLPSKASRFVPSSFLRRHVAQPLTLLLGLQLGCGSPPPSAKRAFQKLKLRDFEGAIVSADKSLSKHPGDPTSYRVKIRAQMELGQLQEAVQSYEEYYSLNQEHDRATFRNMATTTLLQTLRLPNPRYQAKAIAIVERNEVEKLADTISELLGDDSDLVAGAAAVALLRSHPAAPQIAASILKSEDAKARSIVVRGIGRKVGRRAREDIAPLLKDPDEGVRASAIAASKSWPKAERSEALLGALVDSSKANRTQAMRGLINSPSDNAQRAAWAAAVGSSYLGLRLTALQYLTKHEGPELDAHLQKWAESKNASWALATASVFYRRTEVENFGVFQKWYASPQWTVRVSAITNASTGLSRETLLPFLGTGLADPHWKVQLASARALLSRLVLAPATTTLEQALQSENQLAQVEAAAALARRGHLQARKVLSHACTSDEAEVVNRAIAAHRVSKFISLGLIKSLGSEDLDTRLAAADTILSLPGS